MHRSSVHRVVWDTLYLLEWDQDFRLCFRYVNGVMGSVFNATDDGYLFICGHGSQYRGFRLTQEANGWSLVEVVL